VLSLLAVAPARADHSVTELISVPSNGVDPATLLPSGGFTADGNHAVLSTDQRLDPADTDSQTDVYLRSFLTDTTRLISVGPNGGNGPFPASPRALSDGSRIVFSTRESLVAADTDSNTDLYERVGNTTTLLTVGPSGGNGPFDVVDPTVTTSDATHVFFQTAEQLTSDDSFNGTDVYERSAGSTTLVSTGPAGGGCGGTFSCLARISDDGSRVLIGTDRQLTSDDSDSQYDVYLRAGGTTTLVSTGPSGGNGALPAFASALSADGTRAVFWTTEQLVSQDTDSARDVYMWENGTTTLISTGPTAGPVARDANTDAVSRDGSRIFFHTAETLTADDTDTQDDVYERRGATTTLISRNTPDATGQSTTFAPRLEDISDDGRKALFTSVSPLTPDDTDPPHGCWENDDGDFVPKDCKDVFLYDESTDSITLVSTGPGAGGGYDVENGGTAITADGGRAFFITREPILGQDAFSYTCMNDFSQVGCIDVYERTLGPTPTTSLVTQGPTGGFGPNEVFGPDIEVNVGPSQDGRRYYFYTDEQLTSSDTDAAYDLYVSAIAEVGGIARPKGATPIHASLVPAFNPCSAANHVHGPPLAFGSCNPPQPASPNLTVGGNGGGGTPAKSIGYVRMDVIAGTPGPPDNADVVVTVSLSNVMNLSGLSDYTGDLDTNATIRMTDRGSGSGVASTIEDFPLDVTVPCTATADTTVGSTCSVQTTFDSVVPGLATENIRSVQELGQVRILDGNGSLFAVQGVFVP
jgi:hypothetical protein